MTKRRKPPQATIINLNEARAHHRLALYRRKIAQILAGNRKAISRLFTTGALFSRAGTKAGRDLLLAHQHLLKVVSLLNHLSDDDIIPAPRSGAQTDAIYSQLDALLDRTSELTSRTGQFLGRLKGE